LTLAWVILQGLFGKYTVTLKLYPAIVTLHLLGGLALLALLALQHESYCARPLELSPPTRRWAAAAVAALWLQIAFGGWVSSNYAVLACTGFPRCNGAWWPPMDFADGFTLLRELGESGSGVLLSFDALVAIHFVHRWFAVAAVGALGVLAVALWKEPSASARRFGAAIGALVVLQVLSGLSNIVLGWPLAAALGHSGGAAALVMGTTMLLARSASAWVHGTRGVGRVGAAA
jgi:cytochrome c oxidase assembly protein subunit 15